MPEKAKKVYALADPKTGEIRWVGATADLRERVRRHLQGDTRGTREWCGELAAQGDEPRVVLLCSEPADWEEEERRWIAYGRAQGWPLLNILDGGAKPPPCAGHSPETREKLARSKLGNQWNKYGRRTEETRAKIGAAHKGRRLSEETRAKIRASKQGKKLGPFLTRKRLLKLAELIDGE